MRYVKHTANFGLLYTSSGKSPADPWTLSASVDSDWASCKDTRRSRTGWLVWLNNDLICFGSKLQPAVARSSAEAEYMALSMVIQMLLWIVHIIEAIPGQFIRRPIPILEDNRPCINLADNHAASKFTRHIGIAHHFLREHCHGGNKQFKITWTDSNSQPADGMTKPLPRAPFEGSRRRVVSDAHL